MYIFMEGSKNKQNKKTPTKHEHVVVVKGLLIIS